MDQRRLDAMDLTSSRRLRRRSLGVSRALAQVHGARDARFVAEFRVWSGAVCPLGLCCDFELTLRPASSGSPFTVPCRVVLSGGCLAVRGALEVAIWQENDAIHVLGAEPSKCVRLESQRAPNRTPAKPRRMVAALPPAEDHLRYLGRFFGARM